MPVDNIDVEDKTFLHKNHKNHDVKKFHIKLVIKSKELKKISKIEAHKIIFSILKDEMNKRIHALEIEIK